MIQYKGIEPVNILGFFSIIKNKIWFSKCLFYICRTTST